MLRLLRIILLLFGFFIVLGAAYLFFNKTVEAPSPSESSVVPDTTSTSTSGSSGIKITHSISKKVHTVKGLIPLPNPCYSLAVTATVASGTPSIATIAIGTTDLGGVCVQVVDERSFSVSFTAPTDVVLEGSLNGQPVSLIDSAS